MARQSEELTEFYRAYRDWSLDPVEGDIFSKHHGLCSTLAAFAAAQGYDGDSLDEEMANQFSNANLELIFPFNSPESYEREHDLGLMLQNTKRLLWVNEHCR